MEDILLPEKEASRKVHHGKGVRFLRETLNISQAGLGQELGINQQGVSRIETSEKLSEKKILQIAQFFNVPTELIKNFSPAENAKNVISNPKFDNFKESTGAGSIMIEPHINNVDPKVYEFFEKLIAEKDKLLAEKDLRIADLQKQLEYKK